jgi:hypothetical protein
MGLSSFQRVADVKAPRRKFVFPNIKAPQEKVHVSKYKIWTFTFWTLTFWTFTFGQAEMKQAIKEVNS